VTFAAVARAYLSPMSDVRSVTPSRHGREARFVFAVVVLTVFAIHGEVHAQQTYFNVPNAELAKRGEAFVQQQLFLGKSGQGGLTVDFGLTDYLEVGFNAVAVSLYAPPRSTIERAPSVLANAQVMLEPVHWLHLLLGTMQGISARSPSGPRAAYAARGHAMARFGDDESRFGNYLVGAYAGTRAMLGEGSLGGGFVGAEVPLLGKRLRAVGDWVIGTNEESVIVLGLESLLDAEGRWDLAIGAQLPSPGSDNEYGCVLQIAWLSKEE
jgi:hypothetical protein